MAKAIKQDIEHYMQRSIKNLPEESDGNGEENDDQETGNENDAVVVGNDDDMVVAEDQAQETEDSQDMDGFAEREEEEDMVIDDAAQPNESNVEDEKEQDVDIDQDYKEEIEDTHEESEDEQYIPAHTEISLFQKYLQHPLFNDD